MIAPFQLNRVNEDSVGVCWTRHLSQVKSVADCTSVIGAVIDDVKEDFLPRHGSPFAVDKFECHKLFQAVKRQRFRISRVSPTGLEESLLKFF